jgi:hypothetical protein
VVVLSGCGTPEVLRDVIARSWERYMAAAVDPHQPGWQVLDADWAVALRAAPAHPHKTGRRADALASSAISPDLRRSG